MDASSASTGLLASAVSDSGVAGKSAAGDGAVSANGSSQDRDASNATAPASNLGASAGNSVRSMDASAAVGQYDSSASGNGSKGLGTTTTNSATGAVQTKLPTLPELTNVTVTGRDDSVGIDFDPFDTAVDYRVYPLPNDADVTTQPDGSITVKNAVYRCAGLRQTTDLETNVNQGASLVLAGAPYNWTAEVTQNPTLGYVYTTPAADRSPVYAVAGYVMRVDGNWRESRWKIYTTSSAVRQSYLAKNFRDDGVVFYVPSAASSATHTVYGSENSDGTHDSRYYFNVADAAVHAQDSVASPTPAFEVLNAAAADTEPLMAVQYNEDQPHTELSVGPERYHRAAYQGPGPLWHLEWAGLPQGKTTTLVVEALATGCPFQGFLSAQHLAAPPHQTFYTLSELQTMSPTGEVFINGEYDVAAPPKAIARSFVQVSPHSHDSTSWDWYEGFADNASLTPAAAVAYPGCADPTMCGRWQTPKFDLSVWSIDNPNGVMTFTYGAFLGQLWTAFDDWQHDVTGKIRLTALQKAAISSDPTKFLHVTWGVDVVGTDRRYPQLIVSDQDAPVQSGFANPNNNSLLVQSIEGPQPRFELQAIHGLVNGSPWDINNQAPAHTFTGDPDEQTVTPVEPFFEHAGVDRTTAFDAYISSNRIYTFFDGAPAGCTTFPAGFSLLGNVTVTFGDVLYHEGAADEAVCSSAKPYPFLHAHQCNETKRHFDDLGFKSGTAAPSWDETKFACGSY